MRMVPFLWGMKWGPAMTMTDVSLVTDRSVRFTLALVWFVLCLFGSMLTFNLLCDLVSRLWSKR
jgi:hypothetical protein